MPCATESDAIAKENMCLLGSRKVAHVQFIKQQTMLLHGQVVMSFLGSLESLSFLG